MSRRFHCRFTLATRVFLPEERDGVFPVAERPAFRAGRRYPASPVSHTLGLAQGAGNAQPRENQRLTSVGPGTSRSTERPVRPVDPDLIASPYTSDQGR